MCGILGGNHIKWDYKSAIESMRHRGPDGMKISSYGDLTMAFVRLSIMDLSDRAMQPMDSTDGMVHIVFNGEIYGFNDLRNGLVSSHQFRTTSDTEVVLNAYLEYGDSFIDRIDGMYAIAIFDERDHHLRLYRDRYGIKPLYYYHQDTFFAFSSELKGITRLIGEDHLRLDHTAIYDFLNYQYIPEPKSIYKNVYKLEPAHVLELDTKDNRIIRCERYWTPQLNTSVARKRDVREVGEHLRELISSSVSKQMIADVPVGTFLSGGIDSSIITYESSSINPDICAFTMGFEDKEFDETAYAKLMTERYSLNTTTECLNNESLSDIKGSLSRWYDEPFADTSAYPTYSICRLAKTQVTVVLTGDGGDELFGGYDRYERFLNQRSLRQRSVMTVKRIIKLLIRYQDISKKLSDLIETDFNIYRREMGAMGVYPNPSVKEFARRLDIPSDYDVQWAFRKYWIKDLPPLSRLRFLDFNTYLPGDILTKVDRTSMQVSLEARVPFLDRNIVEYAFSLSEEECNPGYELKGALKSAYKDVIPSEILYREKRGFAVPWDYLGRELNEGHVWLGVLKNEWPDILYKEQAN